LYIKDHRLKEAAPVLDRALSVLNTAPDTVPMDRLRVLNLRGVLDAREGKWPKAEEEFQGAISLANGEKRMDPDFHCQLLANYAHALRRNHHRREARSVEARAAAERGSLVAHGLVDVSEFSAISNTSNK
jgi:hypothetical protein